MPDRRIPGRTVSRRVALAVVALLLAVAGAANAATNARPKPTKTVLGVAHAPVTATDAQYVDVAPEGASVGDLRTYYLPLTRRSSTGRIGYLTGTLTTVAIDKPRAGMELRTANLVFVVGRASDQIVVGGVSAYSQTAPTISRTSVVTRPVVGGSGTYAGARGWCVTTHLANGSWTHVFHLTTDRP